MEFYASVRTRHSVADLQRAFSIGGLTRWCSSITEVFSDEGERGEIYCVWGRFRIHREFIRDGVRFTLPGCPNSFQWTITTGQPPDPDAVVIHATINRSEHDPDFIETIQQFVEDFREGIEAA